MPKISALFWDVGGVLLTNAWDREQRNRALEQFHLDPQDFEDRHAMVISSFERGKIGLDEYLDHAVFYRERPFTRSAFQDCMFSLSQAHSDVLEFARELAESRQHLMATINNESKELNHYRIETFGLRKIFTLFVSSCYVGLRKPEEGIYRLALEVSQRDPEECCFIDDRTLNLECARKLGMKTIQMENVEQLRRSLREMDRILKSA